MAALRSVVRGDQLNLVLMLFSASAAMVVPCQLLVGAYLFLGPLHYLTELSWLRDRQHFTTGRHDWLWLLALACLNTLGMKLDRTIGFDWRNLIVILAFTTACALAFGRSPKVKLAASVSLLVLIYAGRHEPGLIRLALMLPTMLHVLVFTGLFMLTGALRSRSNWGFFSCVVLVLLAGMMVASPTLAFTQPPPAWLAPYLSPFRELQNQVAYWLGRDTTPSSRLALTRLLGFAYTFHYLNWFSKTRLLGWHEVSRARLGLIVVAYAGAIALYAVNFQLGYLLVGILGMAHVFLEFPLDTRTIAGLPRLVLRSVRPPAGATATAS